MNTDSAVKYVLHFKPKTCHMLDAAVNQTRGSSGPHPSRRCQEGAARERMNRSFWRKSQGEQSFSPFCMASALDPTLRKILLTVPMCLTVRFCFIGIVVTRRMVATWRTEMNKRARTLETEETLLVACATSRRIRGARDAASYIYSPCFGDLEDPILRSNVEIIYRRTVRYSRCGLLLIGTCRFGSYGGAQTQIG